MCFNILFKVQLARGVLHQGDEFKCSQAAVNKMEDATWRWWLAGDDSQV